MRRSHVPIMMRLRSSQWLFHANRELAFGGVILTGAELAQTRGIRLTLHSDLIIAGAGCAGLSLAVALLHRGYCGSIRLIEPRRDYRNDRTWCTWDVDDHPFAHCITAKWQRWRIAGHDQTVMTGSMRYPYVHIPAATFYAATQDLIEAAPNISLQRGERVESVAPTSQGIEVTTHLGRYRGTYLFDSRPPTSPPPFACTTVHWLPSAHRHRTVRSKHSDTHGFPTLG